MNPITVWNEIKAELSNRSIYDEHQFDDEIRGEIDEAAVGIIERHHFKPDKHPTWAVVGQYENGQMFLQSYPTKTAEAALLAALEDTEGAPELMMVMRCVGGQVTDAIEEERFSEIVQGWVDANLGWDKEKHG